MNKSPGLYHLQGRRKDKIEKIYSGEIIESPEHLAKEMRFYLVCTKNH